MGDRFEDMSTDSNEELEADKGSRLADQMVILLIHEPISEVK